MTRVKRSVHADENQAAAEQVSERSTDQDERPEKQSIGFDDPLHVRHRRLKTRLEGR